MINTDTQLQSVFDSLEDGILVANEALAPIWLNQASRRLLQINDVSFPDFTAVPEFLRQLGLDPATGFANEKKRVQRLLLSRDGNPATPVEAVLTFGQLGPQRVVTAAIRDISVQQQMEKAVYESRKTQAIGALADGIAHDFNNILTAVISQIDLVLYGPELAAGARQHLIYAQTSARRGAELVGKLQAFSRQSPPRLEMVSLTDIIDQAVFMLRHSIPPLIEIVRPARSEPCLVRADTNQIVQVILNIGINARDAMPKGGTLTLTLETVEIPAGAAPPRKEGSFACLRIRDTGHGMSPEVVSRIFEPYFSTKDLSRGPGLGLSIATSVIAEHSGWIEVESAEGAGACFSIYLPRSGAPVAATNPGIREVKKAEGRERVLVVDDEELVRMVIKAILTYRGYEVFEATDGEDAIQKYQQTEPAFDLVLMDLHMPRLNGYDALLRIRQTNPKLKAILLSGGSQDPASLGGDIEGVAYLQKPFDNQELANVVRKLLDAKS
jgi:signal transduction histidine kinase/ActR/RegA family two-component response regulator